MRTGHFRELQLYSSILSIHSQIYINCTLFRLYSVYIRTTILETPTLIQSGNKQ